MTMEANEMTAFRQSRVYAQGWNAGRLSKDPGEMLVLNPYRSDPERSRWNEGFTEAVG
jgi:hypothetical protein